MSKAIVVFSDGTGNSSAALQRTNVWRLYDALDTSVAPPPGQRRQIAYYDNGVGTSSFRPAAILGGVFGWGLKRNVLDCYKFVCRNYSPGDANTPRDEIYLFGFSRGAFTIRVVAGLIARQGIVQYQNEAQIDRDSEDVYRAYRRSYGKRNMVARFFRAWRDRAIAAARKRDDLPQVQAIPRYRPNIRFVGAWDTVAAYGMPIAELTRAFDKYIWPLSMPDYMLCEEVEQARHALALDDERDTFHPLLWDEVHEQKRIAQGKAPRLEQVWFTGMHSDVGGGYADESLSYVSLQWMLTHATLNDLRFTPHEVSQIESSANPVGPMHDSRSGLAGYYRYQPRKISAKLDPPPPDTRIVQNPDLGNRGLLTSVKVHESVVERIERGNDRYAPIVLPASFDVVKVDAQQGTVVLPQPACARNGAARANEQERVWNLVWHRRLNYFGAVAISLLLLLMPVFDWSSACTGPQCLLAPVIASLSVVVPRFLETWVDSWARSPAAFALLFGVLIWLVKRAGRLQTEIHDRMRSLWDDVIAGKPLTGALPTDRVYELRTGDKYQCVLRYLKWTLIPGIFGVFARGLIITVCAGAVAYALLRTDIVIADRVLDTCPPGGATLVERQGAPARPFHTSHECFATGLRVEKDVDYRITFAVTHQWLDNTIVADPTGFGSDRMPFLGDLVAMLKRSPSDPWFRPLLRIEPGSGLNYVQALDVRQTASSDTIYYADFTAGAQGEVILYVNDVRLPSLGWHKYDRNLGRAQVCIERVDGDHVPPEASKCMAAYGPITPVWQTHESSKPAR